MISKSNILERLRELEAKATPGPFYATCNENSYSKDDTVWTVGPNDKEENWSTDCGLPGYGISEADAMLHSESRNAMIRLLKVIEIQREALEALTCIDATGNPANTHTERCIRCLALDACEKLLWDDSK